MRNSEQGRARRRRVTAKSANRRPDLVGARLKVERAREHIEALDMAVHGYVEGEGPVEYLVDHVRGGLIVSARQVDPPPLRLAIICGDAVHNLRTALDYLVWQLGIADTGMVSRQSAFPIVGKAKGWRSAVRWELALLSDAHVSSIRRLQPFVDASDNSPGVVIAMLGALDDWDKHRLQLPVTAAAIKTEFEVAPGFVLTVTRAHHRPVELGSEPVELARLVAHEFERMQSSRIDIKALTHLTVSFGHADGPTVWNLRQAADLVADIIRTYELELGEAS